MNKLFVVALALACLARTDAQVSGSSSAAKPATQEAPASTPPVPVTFTSDSGFTYTYPSDWEVVDAKPMLPVAQMHARDSASSGLESQAAGCTQIGLLLRHGIPRSSIVVVVLPYSCVDNRIKASDLAGVAGGVAVGLSKGFTLTDPIYTAYKLGTVEFWAERAKGSPKAHPEVNMTLETTCGLLKSALVCWMGFAQDEAAIRTFEGGATSIDGSPATSLIPTGAFDRKIVK